MKKKFTFIIILFSIFLIIFFGNTFFIYFENNNPSISIGDVNSGQMSNGKRLPTSGKNFITYSYFGSLIGRTHVNSNLRDLILESYQQLHLINPNSCFVYGESSWKNGGRLWPHRSHKNGLAVDFMVPVLNESGKSICLDTNIFNKWGYSLEFDLNGKYGSTQIDFNSIANHLNILNIHSFKYKIKIKRVIFDNDYHSLLFETPFGNKIKKEILFTKFKPWVRHDEHYHVDFEIISE